MKRIILVAALAVCAFGNVQAQFGWGLKAGVNLIDAEVSGGTENFKSSNLTGFQVGPMIELMVPVIGIGVDAAVLYSQDGFKVAGEEFTNRNLLVPVNLKYKLSFLGLIGAYATAGPYVKLKLSSDDFNLAGFENAAKAKSFGAGLNFGLGIELLSHLQVGANYQLGLTDNYGEATKLDLAKEAIGGKSRGWVISAAYLF
ncbi:membrane protein [Bacteroidia bacterium]|nr:membrane protein [Bacteroidia bacterium]